MKTCIKSLFTAFILIIVYSNPVSATAVRPTDDTAPKAPAASFQVAVFPASSASVLNVCIDKAAGKTVLVRVLNENGLELSRQYIRKKAGRYQVRFNLEEVIDGRYNVEVTDGQTKSAYPFTLSTQAPVVVSRTISLS